MMLLLGKAGGILLSLLGGLGNASRPGFCLAMACGCSPNLKRSPLYSLAPSERAQPKSPSCPLPFHISLSDVFRAADNIDNVPSNYQSQFVSS